MRNNLAVKEEYKNSSAELVVREYTVKSRLRVRDGVVGPLQETFTDGTSKIYFGGNQQYEFIDNLKKGNWENFLMIKNEQGVILK